MPAINPPARIIGLAPYRSTAQPTRGPPALPSARARLKTNDICAEVRPNSVRMGTKNLGNPWDMDPFPNMPNNEETTTTHHP